MALILKKLFQGYFWLFTEKADPRTENLLLMSSPLPTLAIGILYLYLIKVYLPKFMENRQPYKLDAVMKIFNLSQVILNAYLCTIAWYNCFLFDWSCAPIDFSVTPRNLFNTRLVHLYFLTKIADLLDTIFFILRGKQNQATFLHIYHHFGMTILGWVGVRFLAGGHSFFLGAANSFVHTIMYFYYFLTIYKPELKKKLWWKKYITQLQLLQFVFFFFIYGQLIFKPDCEYPKVASYLIVPQSIVMIIMFSDFYRKAYLKPKTNRQ